MKTRERLQSIKTAKSFSERFALANDEYPGSSFDELLAQMSEIWVWKNRSDKAAQAATRCPKAAKHFRRIRWVCESLTQQDFAELDSDISECVAGWGEDLLECCMTGNSAQLHALADALDRWLHHAPSPDNFRAWVILWAKLAKRGKRQNTMRDLMQVLTNHKVITSAGCSQDDARRKARKFLKEIGHKLSGVPGRPKTGTRIHKSSLPKS